MYRFVWQGESGKSNLGKMTNATGTVQELSEVSNQAKGADYKHEFLLKREDLWLKHKEPESQENDFQSLCSVMKLKAPPSADKSTLA